MDDEIEPDDETPRRRANRAGVVLQLEFRSASHLLVTYCTNLSRGGLFVPTASPVPTGTRVTLSLSVPGESAPAPLSAKVRWVRHFDAAEGPAGMGLAFEGIDEVLGDRIDELVSRFMPLRIILVGERPSSLHHLAGMVRSLVTCETEIYDLEDAIADPQGFRGADLVLVELDSGESALGIVRTLAGLDPAPPRIGLCEAQSELRGRAAAYARIVGTPIDPGELRTAVLESVAQVEEAPGPRVGEH